LSLKGEVQAERLPLHALEPYFGDRLNLELLRADTSYRGSLIVGLPAPCLTLALAGDLALEDFRANTLAPSKQLLSWKSLSLRRLALDISPGKPLRLSVRETVLSDYFARVIVQANGRLNLQGLVKDGEVVAPNETAGAVVSAAQSAAPAVGQPDIRLGPIGLVNGRVFFSDRFIQANYSANLSELTGGISAFASAVPPGDAMPALVDLTLKGHAEGTAQLDISGKLNPLARPLALDIQGKVRDLELPPLSPYSAKYAGYGIERGKLSVNVAYQIGPSGQLSASNQIVLNLIGKAITAPFSLIAGALGGGDELSRVDFAPGGSVLDEAGRKRLGTVAKALADRPALQLTVIGPADLAVECSAYQRARIQRLLLAEKRRELSRSGANITG
jgi:hypothetical protein